MPFATAADGTRLSYEVVGNPDGEPLLMIQGLGANGRGWARQRKAFGQRYKVVLFDNRGAGDSDKPPGPYDLAVMAEDAMAVLDAIGQRSAHVVGASMGGIIAQIAAVRHPERVRSLVLACTSCHHHPWRRELLAEWSRLAETDGMRHFSEASFRWLVGPRVHRRLAFPASLLWRFVTAAPATSIVSQIAAILSVDDELRFELTNLTIPALVIAGSQDILTPVGDAEEIAERIPRAELVVLWGAGHALMVEQAAAFNRTVLAFLERAGVQERTLSTSSPASDLSAAAEPEWSNGASASPAPAA